jgi:hypothetical protein
MLGLQYNKSFIYLKEEVVVIGNSIWRKWKYKYKGGD